MLLVVATCNQWQRYTLAYANGFQVNQLDAGSLFDPSFYQINQAIPELQSYYGLLSGLVFLIPFSFFGLFTG